jgi:hypothetical protein
MGVKKKIGDGVFIVEGCYQLFKKQRTSANPSIRPVHLPNGLKGVSYV